MRSEADRAEKQLLFDLFAEDDRPNVHAGELEAANQVRPPPGRIRRSAAVAEDQRLFKRCPQGMVASR